jgi:transposase
LKNAKHKWFLGIDWGRKKHYVVVLDCEGKPHLQIEVENTAEAILRFRDRLMKLANGDAGSIAVAIETTHGLVVEFFLELGADVFSINPRRTKALREALYSVSGAKDDRRDAFVLADALRLKRDIYRQLELPTDTLAELREHSRQRDALVREQTRTVLRMRDLCLRCFPELLEITGGSSFESHWMIKVARLVLGRMAPGGQDRPRRAGFASLEDELASILKRHRVRQISAPKILEILRKPRPTVTAGSIAGASSTLRFLIDQLELIRRHLKEGEANIERLVDDYVGECEGGTKRDVEITLSMPGLGSITLAALLAEASVCLQHRDYRQLRILSGVAPVTIDTGGKKKKPWQVAFRRACNKRLRNAVFLWSHCAIKQDPVSRAKYHALRNKGIGHASALRRTADRNLDLLCTLLSRGTTFDADIHRAKLPA